jgi:hypothetical protein
MRLPRVRIEPEPTDHHANAVPLYDLSPRPLRLYLQAYAVSTIFVKVGCNAMNSESSFSSLSAYCDTGVMVNLITVIAVMGMVPCVHSEELFAISGVPLDGSAYTLKVFKYSEAHWLGY